MARRNDFMRHLTFSDHHFFHHKIIKEADRPFPFCNNSPCTNNCVAEMNRFMVQQWNDNVEDDDVVYYLGDFSFGEPSLWRPILKKLRGQKILIRGNHDPTPKKCLESGWPAVHSQLVVTTMSGHRVLLRHKPWTSFSSCHATALGFEVVVHGHIHNRPSPHGHLNINVCVERTGYKPVELNHLVDEHMRVMGYSRRLTDG